MYPTPSHSDHAVRFPSHFHSTTLIADVEKDREGEGEVSPLPPHIEEALRKLEKALKDIKKEVDALRLDVERLKRKGWEDRPLHN